MGLSALSCTCCKTENLYTLNNSPHTLSPLSLSNHHSTSCLYEAHSFQYLIWVEYLSFLQLDDITEHKILNAFIHIVAHVRISLLLKAA